MSPLERKILDEIEKRGLTPKPAYYFLARRSVFWLLAALSILLGAFSVALGLFAIHDYTVTGGRDLSDMPFDDVLTRLPIVWALAFPLFVASAVLSLRHTRRGYRFGAASVLAIAAAASAGLGLALHMADAGRLTHQFLSARVPGYAAYTYVPYSEWSRPDEGYLGGEVLSVEGRTGMRLKDFSGRDWEIDITPARMEDIDGSLAEEGDVAIRGTRTGTSAFKAEIIAPFD
ncbi:MAG: hypothetical protein ACKVP5_06310 [Aestuariivirga sp.]